MPTRRKTKTVRRSITLPAAINSKVQKLVKVQNRSANQVIESLIEAGIQAREAEKRRFFQLAEGLRHAADPAELRRIKEELAHMTFGV